jgi:hypothetical protein
MARKITGLVLLAAVLVGIWQAENLYEWYKLSGYQPSSEIAALADRTTMTEVGRRDFYLADPDVEDKAEFRQSCPNRELSLVLGCYERGNIHLLEVTKAELEAVVPVTAAHEMLHAAYADFGRSQREELNQKLVAELGRITDAKVLELVEEYRRSSPESLENELHSILGTQVANLSPELEAHYRRYFSNRQQVVADYKAYEQVFDNIRDQHQRLVAEIDQLKSQIERAGQQAESLSEQIEELRRQGRVEESNQLVSAQNAAVSRYRSLVNEHNAKVNQANELALQEQDLVNSLDSSSVISTQ